MIEISVELGPRRYPIHIGHGLARKVGDLLAPFRGRRIVVVSSPRIWGLHGDRIGKPLTALGSFSRVRFESDVVHARAPRRKTLTSEDRKDYR